MKDIYRGKLVRLAVEAPEVMTKAHARWERDTEFHRLADGDPAQLWSEKKIREWIEKEMEDDPLRALRFSIRTLNDDKLIGFVGLRPDWIHADAWIGIGIGEREYWGKGYGTDAMRLIVQYAFLEANLRRVTLGLHSYNARALKSYEKVGFKLEGVLRSDTLREGRRTDGIYMGLLREEWQALQGVAA
ncbi:MAG TPA: GNAT family protein [Anaerolineales bacterium]|nr:GNAT family protein [Anaerolineales bacterium]